MSGQVPAEWKTNSEKINLKIDSDNSPDLSSNQAPEFSPADPNNQNKSKGMKNLKQKLRPAETKIVFSLI